MSVPESREGGREKGRAARLRLSSDQSPEKKKGGREKNPESVPRAVVHVRPRNGGNGESPVLAQRDAEEKRKKGKGKYRSLYFSEKKGTRLLSRLSGEGGEGRNDFELAQHIVSWRREGGDHFLSFHAPQKKKRRGKPLTPNEFDTIGEKGGSAPFLFLGGGKEKGEKNLPHLLFRPHAGGKEGKNPSPCRC